MKKINIIVLNYSSGELDIITTKLKDIQIEAVEEYLTEKRGYKLKNIEFMFSENDIEINQIDEIKKWKKKKLVRKFWER